MISASPVVFHVIKGPLANVCQIVFGLGENGSANLEKDIQLLQC